MKLLTIFASFAISAAAVYAGTPEGAVKLIESFDSEGWTYITGTGNPDAAIAKEINTTDRIEGEGSFELSYRFSGNPAESGKPENVHIQRTFINFRCDFSFCPAGISFWVKGKPSNKGELRLVLLQGDMRKAPRTKVLQTYQYTAKSAIRSRKWTKVYIPFEKFVAYDAGDTPLDLSQVIGWRLEVVGNKGGGNFLIDKMEQVTTYRPRWNTDARFNSIFVQLNNAYRGTDWDEVFRDGKAVGIDTWIVQFCIGRKNAWSTSLYKNSTLPWTTKREDIVDRLFAAAEKAGIKVIVGTSYESWSTRQLAVGAHYDDVFSRNRLVIDDLAANFASSPAFAGWYIANEFHDGCNFTPCWYDAAATECLAAYLEKTASYMKSKKDVPVCAAPALFRGFPASMTGDFYDRLLGATPSLDRIYIQDCGGRGPDMITSVSVDLPNYFAAVKAACEKNGVTFGVDIESFYYCSVLKQPRRPKTWEELRPQLEMAGNFTDEITNFSWASFQPGQATYEGYKKYISK